MGGGLNFIKGRAQYLRFRLGESAEADIRGLTGISAKKSAQTLCPAFFCLLLCIIFIFSPLSADAAYKIYLKNGSVIKGVSHYEKSGGEIKFYFEGGAVGIPETDILRIETGKEPLDEEKAKPSVAGKSVEPPRVGLQDEKPAEAPDIKKQADDGDKKSDEITQKEAELKKIEEDLQRTNVRVQNLFLKSTQGTITAPERSMLQQNMVKKRKLESNKKKLEDELKELREKK